MVTVEYRCADGTVLPVEFDRAEDVAVPWRWEREHTPLPFTALGQPLGDLGIGGAERAYAEVGMALPDSWRPGPRACGFMYSRQDPMPPDDLAKMFAGGATLLERFGSSLAIWRDLCRPKCQEVVDFLDGADDTVSLQRLSEAQAYGQQMTMIAAMVCGNDLELLSAACRDVCGDDAPLTAFELTQGYPSETLRADQELWFLGRAVLQSPAIAAALDADDPRSAMTELRASGEHALFFATLDGFLVRYGRRAEGWDIAAPTWSEQRDGFWSQLRQMADPDAPEPEAALAAAAERRETLAGNLEALFTDPDKRARFRRRYERVASYVDVREDRAYWQLVLYGALRHAVLRRGAALLERGVLDDGEDVIHLTPDEIDAAMAGSADDFRALAAARRAEHAAWMKVTPPLVIGATEATGAMAGATGADGRIIRGQGVSRGRVTATARVIVDLEDADRLEAGDVLVCVMTAPPWTPLFALAGAVVGDSGGLGSHPAIAAREYGIPCVLGTTVGTTAIPDGATVTVDGDAGTVELVEVPALSGSG